MQKKEQIPSLCKSVAKPNAQCPMPNAQCPILSVITWFILKAAKILYFLC
ncbi:MAG: hypothetical protein V7K98_03640 [Nostoc sp.]